MQSKYVGDIGDFGKYGLLRYLSGLTDPEAGQTDLRVGMAWYLAPDDCCKRDGRVLGYLRNVSRNHRLYRACDPELWDTLRDIIECGLRCVHQIPRAGILPQDTLYYNALLHFPHRSPQPMRQEIRRLWFEGAIRATEGADLIFLDPDNGVAQDEREMLHQRGPKFTYLSDIRAFWNRCQSLVIYQHLAMGIPAIDFVQAKAELIRAEVGIEPIALRLTSRVFFILPQPCHEERIRTRVRRLLGEPWGQHFELEEVLCV